MSKNILLVEDDNIVAIETKYMLESKGFNVSVVNTGGEAIEQVHLGSVDLILMDIDLGSESIDGAKAAEIILEEYDIPVIFLTNYTEPEVVEKTNTITSYGYVTKNSGPAVVVATINSAFRLFEKQKKAEGKLQHLIEDQNDIIYSIDVKSGEFSYISPAMERITGYSEKDIREMGGRKTFLSRIVQNGNFEEQEKILNMFKNGKQEELAHHLSVWKCKDGTEKYIEDNWVPVYRNRNLEGCYGILRDITERMKTREQLQKALKEKEYLMEEINHRVRNNLTLITSLIHFKSLECKDVVDLSDLQQQVLAIGMVHAKLFQRNGLSNIDFRGYAQELLETVFFSLSNEPVTLKNTIEEIYLPAKVVIPLGLIMNEMAINAIKHGFNGHKNPTFSIKMKYNTKTRVYTLVLSNNGKPFPPDITLENAETLGLQLISDLLEQLEGTLKIKKKPHPVFTITFPFGEVLDNAGKGT